MGEAQVGNDGRPSRLEPAGASAPPQSTLRDLAPRPRNRSPWALGKPAAARCLGQGAVSHDGRTCARAQRGRTPPGFARRAK